jgi:fibronectin-binding autotransporter adhesin
MNVKLGLVCSARALRGGLSMASSLVAAISGLAFLSSSVQAATYTYTATTNANSSNTWSTGTGWTGGTAPVSAADTTLVFGGSFNAAFTATAQDNIAGAFQLNALTLNATNSGVYTSTTYNISAAAGTNTLNFTANGPTTAVVNLDSVKGAFSNNVNFNVSINASIDGGLLTFQGNGSNSFNFSGILSDGSTSAGITKTGSSTLTLSGANTFSGGLTLSQGTLNINNASALGNGAFTLANGVKIDNTSGAAITNTKNNAQTWNGDFSWLGTQALNMGTGDVTLGANSIITVGGTGALTVGGNVSDGSNSYGLTLGTVGSKNSGTLILNGAANSYDGGTVINSGILQVASSPSGSGVNVEVNKFGALATGYALDQATLGRVTANSTGTIALAANSSNNLDFSASGANLGVSLGATGTQTYSGILTQQGTVYRLGGAGGNLIMANALTGANSLEVGNGGSAGTVTLNAAGTYSGGTTVRGVEGSTASMLQTNILTGTSNTPFGSNPSITLKNGTLGLGTAATLSAGNVMNVAGYDVTFDTGTIKLAVGSGSSVTFTANSLNQSSQGGVLYIAPTSSTSLGTTEKVFVTNASSTIPMTVTNGMVSPKITDSTNKRFLTYNATNGFVAAATTAAYGKNNIVAITAAPATALSAYALTTNQTVGGSDNFTIGAGGFLSTVSQNNATGTINFGSTPGYYGIYGGGTSGTNFNATAGVTFYGTGMGFNATNINITGGITFASGSWSFTPQPTGSEVFQTHTPNALTILSGASITESQSSKMTFASIEGSGAINESLANAFTLTINGLNSTGTKTFDGSINGATGGAGNIIKTGTNTQVFAGANTYNGTTTVNGGTLKGTQTSGTPFGVGSVVLGGGNLSIAPSGSGANVAVSGANAAAGSTFTYGANSQLSLDKGANTSLTYTVGNSAAAANSVLVRGTNGTLIITPASGTAALGTATGEKFIVNGGVTTTNGIASAAIIGQDSNANKDGTFLAYDATNGFTAAGVYSDTDFAFPSFNNVEDVTTAGYVDLPTTTVFALRNAGVLSIGSGQTLTISNGSLPGGVILNGGSINGGTLAFAASPGVIYSNLVGGSISSVITGSGGVSIVGPGVTIFLGANTYTTTTQINDSTLSISSNANLGNAVNSLGLNGGTLKSTATFSLGTRAISLNIGQNNYGGVFDVADATTLTSTGVISGSGGLIKNNSGTLVLSGVNTFSGYTVVNGGTLNLSGTSALANSTLTTGGVVFDSSVGSHAFTIGGLSGSANLSLIDNGGNAVALSVGNNNVPTTYSGALSGTGSLVKVGTGTLTLDGASTYTGKTSVAAGTLTVSSLNSVVGGAASSSLGAPITSANGTIAIGATTVAGSLNYVGAGETTDRIIDLAGTTGGATISANGTGALVFSSNLTATGAGAKTLTLSGSSDAAINNIIQGAIVDSGSATSVTKSGMSTWVLAGNNSYTGATVVGTGGTLKIGATGSGGNGPLGTVAAGTTISSGGTLDLNGFTLANAEALTLNGNGVSSGTSTAGALLNSSATGVNYSGLVTLGSASKIVANGNINLTNTGTITGATFGLTLDGTATGSSISSIIGTTTGGVTKAGIGTWTLSGANTYTGTTAVSGGTLVLNANTGSLAASALTFNGNGGTFNYDNTSSSGVKTQTLGALTFSAGQGTVLSTLGGATSSTLTFASLAARASGATGNFVTSGGTNGVSNVIKFTSGPTAGTLIDKGVFYNGSSYAAYDSGGFVRAYGVGDTGYLAAPTGATIGGATIANNVSVTGDITAQTTVTANTINLNANSLTMSAVGQVLSTNGILSSGNSNATLGSTGGTLQSGASGAELVVRVNGSSDQLTIGSIVQNNSAASAFTKSGAGTLVLTGLNTYTGATAINSGTLMIGGAGRLGGGAYAGAIANNGTFAYNSSAAQTLSGNISGIGSVVKNGTSTLTLSGANTYSGGTSVGAGTLVFANSFAMSGSNSITVAATGVAGTNYATVTSTAGALTFGGTLGINLTASLSGGESFNLFSATTGALLGDFGTTTGNVSVTGGYLASLTNNGSGIWTGTDTNGSGLSFTFATSGINAGIFTVSAVPEPATYAAIFGVLALAGAVWRCRRAVRG